MGVIVGVEVAGGTVHVGTGVGTVIRIVLSMPFQLVTAAPTPKMLSVDAPVSGRIESSLFRNICSQYEIGVAVATGGIHVGAGVGGTSVGMGVAVGQCVGVGGMGVFVGVMVGVSVGVAVLVMVGVGEGVGVEVALDVYIGVTFAYRLPCTVRFFLQSTSLAKIDGFPVGVGVGVQ